MVEVDLGLKGSVKDCFAAELCAVASHRRLIECLRDKLANYKLLIANEHTKNEFLDISLAGSLIRCSEDLLNYCESGHTSSDVVVHVLAAIFYLIRDNDGEPDFQSILGFEDDAHVLGRVIEAFKLEDNLTEHAHEIERILSYSKLSGKGA